MPCDFVNFLCLFLGDAMTCPENALCIEDFGLTQCVCDAGYTAIHTDAGLQCSRK